MQRDYKRRPCREGLQARWCTEDDVCGVIRLKSHCRTCKQHTVPKKPKEGLIPILNVSHTHFGATSALDMVITVRIATLGIKCKECEPAFQVRSLELLYLRLSLKGRFLVSSNHSNLSQIRTSPTQGPCYQCWQNHSQILRAHWKMEFLSLGKFQNVFWSWIRTNSQNFDIF